MEENKVNWGQVAIGCGVTAVGLAGVYYIYTKRSAIDEYLNIAKDYEREYREYMADGVIDDDERALLHEKENRMNTLEKYIDDLGALKDLIDALTKLFGVAFGGYIGGKLIDYLRKKYPPGGQTPKDFRCPVCNRSFRTEDQLKRHVREKHNVKTTEPAADAWEIIRSWSSWVIQFMTILSKPFVDFTVWVQKTWEEIPYEVKVAIIIVLAAIIVIIMAFCPGLAPGASEVQSAIAACLV